MHFCVWTLRAKYYQFGLALFCVAGLAGCLPEDTLLSLTYSPDGQLLAAVSEKNGLYVADPAGMETRTIASGAIDADGVSWTTDSLKIAYSSPAEGSLDIYLSSLDGQTTRITSAPSRESQPVIRGNSLIYLTTESGVAELTSVTINSRSTPPVSHLPDSDFPILEPALSPGGQYLAWMGISDLRPQVYCMNLQSGKVDQLTSETDPLSLLIGPLSWKFDESAVGYLRNAPDINVADQPSDEAFADSKRSDCIGMDFCSKQLGTPSSEQLLIHRTRGISYPHFLSEGGFAFTENNTLFAQPAAGKLRTLSLDLKAGLSVSGGEGGDIAFISANQLIGITSASLERARILTFDLEDKFLLAEEYFRSGSESKSYDLYQELAASVQRTRDPEMARFVYIANLRRLGRTDKAVAEIEKILSTESTTETMPRQFLWRLLGYSYLLELDNLPKAKTSFEHYEEITSTTQNVEDPESALNALDIMRHTNPETVRLYARAVKARLNGDFAQTDKLFGELLSTAPEVFAVQREYLNALEGFDREVYYFSPTQRPFQPTKFQQAEYLERFVQIVPASLLARSARLDLFLLRIEMGSYARARQLLDEALTSGSAQGRPEGILEVFRNYLETPEPQPWINQAIPEVFLHPEIRPRLEASASSPEDRLLIGVVATKMALLQNNPDQARREADTALAEWGRLAPADQSGDMAALYGRLLVLRAREAELRNLYSEAAEEYGVALKMLADKKVDNFEFQEEIRYRAALLNAFVSQSPTSLDRLRQMEIRTGTELINPTWEPEVLQSAIRDNVNYYDATTSTLKAWAAYEAGIQFGKLHRGEQARAAYLLASSHLAPDFIKRKATFELAALDELEGDPWNAARKYAQLAAMPASESDIKMWCSYQIARLHLSINYKTIAAREALALIVSNRPDTPLAIQARELLVSTSTR